MKNSAKEIVELRAEFIRVFKERIVIDDPIKMIREGEIITALNYTNSWIFQVQKMQSYILEKYEIGELNKAVYSYWKNSHYPGPGFCVAFDGSGKMINVTNLGLLDGLVENFFRALMIILSSDYKIKSIKTIY